MGYYVNEDSKGNDLPHSYEARIAALKADGATEVDGKQFQENLICVVDNDAFSAAGYCYSPSEHDYFLNDGSSRPKTWLVHPEAKKIAK